MRIHLSQLCLVTRLTRQHRARDLTRVILRPRKRHDIRIDRKYSKSLDRSSIMRHQVGCRDKLPRAGVSSGTNLTFRTLTTARNFSEILECRGYHLYDFIH